ncbi:hypothetical protein [Micromonospora sp. B006]|uniref:hypothetical protein n=1 Tax=Micromonospora sp. B006 TaxID=2201999 RepID=UPI000E2FF874|nr:hypothetical protein [Micromonospora sp. B006]
MSEPPDEGERARVFERLATACDVVAILLAMTGDEEPAGLAQLLALTLRLAGICCQADSKL